MYSFIFIHSVMSENDKNVSLIVITFTRNEVRGIHLVFSKEEISRFYIWNFESGRSVGRKVLFFQLPWDNQNFQESQIFGVY